MSNARREFGEALCKAVGGVEWCTWLDGFMVRMPGADSGTYYTRAKARELTGIAPTPRPKKPIATQGAQGEWNAFASLVLAVSGAKR